MSHQLRLPRPPTDRQLRVLFASKRLRSQKAAARELGISYQTVKNRARIYRALCKADPSLLLLTERGCSARAITKDKGTPEEHAEWHESVKRLEAEYDAMSSTVQDNKDGSIPLD